ncbi:hypoxanthine phosphoribosyltransferase [Oleidesulfovibrio sp.]|uniref:hypoxanthine phosphoribosyltransferase n=1 Tax=Oleidesulfovibrio sp. TaxID=2909707 RepID=UPI003A838AF9
MTVTGMDVVYTSEQVQERVRELAAQVNAEYEGKPLVVVCVLKGAFMFFSDLLKHLTVQPEIDFIRVASYGNATSRSKNISFTKDLEVSIDGKHVLVVEDIVDTGHTVEFLYRQLAARGAASIKLCAIVDKSERREVDVAVDFAGFALQKGYIIGYGMDYAERYRELDAIYDARVED